VPSRGRTPRPTASARITGPEGTLVVDPEQQRSLQQQLRAHERSTASPAGSVFPYGIDVFHRGTNMTEPFGHRYAVMPCFKRAANAGIGYHAWPFHHTQPWANVFEHARPEQLSCFGVPCPGDPFWTEATLSGAQVRYPKWDLTPYREATRSGRP